MLRSVGGIVRARPHVQLRHLHGYPRRQVYGSRLAGFTEGLEQRLSALRKPKWLLLAGGAGLCAFGVQRYAGNLAEAEHQRAAWLTNSERTVLGGGVGSFLALLPDSQVNGLIDQLDAVEGGESLSWQQRAALHALMLRSLALSDKVADDGLRSRQLRSAAALLGGGTKEQSLRAANLLLCMLQGEGVVEDDVRAVRAALATLQQVVEDEGKEDVGDECSQYLRNSLVMLVSRLAELSPAAAPDLSRELGMHFLSDLSQAPAVSNRFLLPIISGLAESTANGGAVVDEAFLSFLERAVMFNRARFSPTQQGSSSGNVEDLRKGQTEALATNSSEGELLLEQVARCLANVALSQEDGGAFAIEHGCLKTLKIVTEHSTSYATQLQAARALANFSSSKANVPELVSDGWVPVLLHWLTQECRLSVTGKIAADNESRIRNTKARAQHGTLRAPVRQPQYDERLVSSCGLLSLANIASADAHAAVDIAKRLPFTDLIKVAVQEGSPSFPVNLCRLLAAVASQASDKVVAKELMSRVGLWGLKELLSVTSADTRPLVARMIASICVDGNVANMILEDILPASVHHEEGGRHITPIQHGWDLIAQLAQSTDVKVQRHACRAIANISSGVRSVDTLLKKPDLMRWLDSWATSSDEVLAANAVRAQATLLAGKLTGARYAQDVFLLHPPPSAAAQEPDFDVVFLHGIAGNAIHTWESGDGTLWPQAWLPKYFPKARVLTLGHNTALTQWSVKSQPLEVLARDLVDKLALANVGSKPIVFVTHSFGGIILKHMLRYANDRDPELLDKLRGVVFYSVPHRGADIASYAETVIFRRSQAIEMLHPKAGVLEQLQEEFEELLPTVHTLSFGENDQTCVSKYCFQLVSDESANPQFGTDAQHKFVKLDVNHYETCKPVDEQDPSFAEVVRFIDSCIKEEAA